VTGVTDGANIARAAAANADMLLGPGNWYVANAVITAQNLRLRGSGMGTTINVRAASTGFTFNATGQLILQDMSFALGAGSLGIQDNGAGNAIYNKLFFGGSTAAGGIKINGDDSDEKHFSDIIMQTVGGVAFGYYRTTTTDAGGLYLDRVRVIAPPAVVGTHAFLFTASGGVVSAPLQMDNCVADNYYDDAVKLVSMESVHVNQLWATINSAASNSVAPIHITGGNDIHFGGNGYALNNTPSGPAVLVDGGTTNWSLGGGFTFNGNGVALAMSAAGGGFWLGDYVNLCAGALSDTPTAVTNLSPISQPRTFWTNGNDGQSGCNAYVDTESGGPYPVVYERNNQGTLQWVNSTFSGVLAALTQTGLLLVSALQYAGAGTHWSGSGAPAAGLGAVGDYYFRVDTPGVALQRIYVKTGAAIWAGIV